MILIGNLTRDPQMSYLPSQTPVVEFGLAVNRRSRGPDNQQREDTCFCRLPLLRQAGRDAPAVRDQGPADPDRGAADFDTWEGKDGTKQSKHRVFVERFQFLGTGQRPAAGAAAPHPRRPRRPAPEGPVSDAPPPPSEYEEPPAGENIPF